MYVLFCRVLLTRYLAETAYGKDSSLMGIIAISAMWDAVESMSELECFPKRQLYSRPLSHGIRERVKALVVFFCLPAWPAVELYLL